MRLLRFTLLMLTLLVFHAPSAFADPIIFTHQGVGSGTIGGIPFATTSFTITALADTLNVQPIGGSGFFINHDSAMISITGVGTFIFTSGTRTFVNFGLVGFSRAGVGGADLFNGPASPLFAAWDMLSPIGPVTGDGGILQWGLPHPAVLTNGGQLIFNDSGSPAAFTASEVPEPASLTLLGLGFGAAAIVRRFRRRK